MTVRKITPGFVIQTFDTETRKYINQVFIAASEVNYENERGQSVSPQLMQNITDGTEPYLSFDMQQPRYDGAEKPI